MSESTDQLHALSDRLSEVFRQRHHALYEARQAWAQLPKGIRGNIHDGVNIPTLQAFQYSKTSVLKKKIEALHRFLSEHKDYASIKKNTQKVNALIEQLKALISTRKAEEEIVQEMRSHFPDPAA